MRQKGVLTDLLKAIRPRHDLKEIGASGTSAITREMPSKPKHS